VAAAVDGFHVEGAIVPDLQCVLIAKAAGMLFDARFAHLKQHRTFG
jgi:hypothetical protein